MINWFKGQWDKDTAIIAVGVYGAGEVDDSITKHPDWLGIAKEFWEIEQILGVALGYPYYCDDKKNFPNSTKEDGVCVGEHTPLTLAMEAASKLKHLAPVARGWMPIDSANNIGWDGVRSAERIWLYFPFDKSTHVGYWENQIGNEGWTSPESGELLHLYYDHPTHWMPLPQPPKKE